MISRVLLQASKIINTMRLEAKSKALFDQIQLAKNRPETNSQSPTYSRPSGDYSYPRVSQSPPSSGHSFFEAATPQFTPMPSVFEDSTPVRNEPVNAEPLVDADEIIGDVTDGWSIDQIAEDRGMTRDEVIAALENGGMEVGETEAESANGDVQTTEIHDPDSGQTVTEYYDHHDDSYETHIDDGDTETTLPRRDGSGRKITTDYDSDSGVLTTRYEDDLGSGTITEEVLLPNGTKVETVTPTGEAATTTVYDDGAATVLASTQDQNGGNVDEIKEQLAAGKSLRQIAEDRGVTTEQLVAELEATGVEVSSEDPEHANGDVQTITLDDPHTGDTTVYYHDYHHDTSTTVTTVDGIETTVSKNGNGVSRHTVHDLETGEKTTTISDPNAGTETEIGVDEDGRITKTVTEDINDGEPVEYEVAPGDSLIEIANDHGVTLEQLRETNPEFFEGGRDPDLIDVGEQVTIEDGTRTTVEVTFNDHTLITNPDGSVTLRNNNTDTEFDIEAGSLEHSIAETLIAVNPDSADPAEAEEAQIVKTVIEGMFAGKSYGELMEQAGAKREETETAIEEYGLGAEAVPTVEEDDAGNPIVVDFQGERPEGVDRDWGPVRIEGVWRWVHPEVAQAIAAENTALGELEKRQAELEEIGAQINLWALDPDSEQALEGAGETLDEALGKHGYSWKRPEPTGNLSDAEADLANAEARLEEAGDALEAYEEAERLQGEAIRQQENLPYKPDPNAEYVSETGSGSDLTRDAKEYEAALANIKKLFYQADYQRTRGDGLIKDSMIAHLESQFEGVDGLPEGVDPVEVVIGDEKVQLAPDIADAYENDGLAALIEGGKPVRIQIESDGEKEWRWVDAELASTWLELKDQQSILDKSLTIGEAYVEYFDAHGESADIELQAYDLEQQMRAEYNEQNSHLFEEDKKHSRFNGDYLGLFTGQEVVEEDGQLWIVNHFEHGDTRSPLTFSLEKINQDKDFYQRTLSEEWLASNAEYQALLGGKLGQPPLETIKSDELAAGENVNRVLAEQLGVRLEDLDGQIEELEAEFNDLLEEHGPGTVRPPDVDIPTDFEPVEIEFEGQSLKVHPDVAEAYQEIGAQALSESDLPVQIEMPGGENDEQREWRWMDPELAQKWLSLDGEILNGFGPIDVDLAGRTIRAHPDDAESYEMDGIQALGTNELPVQIKMDTDGDGEEDEWRWVDPEVAQTWFALDMAREMRSDLESTRATAESAAEWLNFQRQQPLKLRDDPTTDDHLMRLQSAYFDENRQQVLDDVQVEMQDLYDRGYDDTFQPVDSDTIAEALSLDVTTDEGREALDKVESEIRDIGGEDAKVRTVPFFYVDPEMGRQQSAVFAVENDEGNIRYVDIAGKSFSSVEDFQDNNNQFSENGHLIVPTEFRMSPDDDGSIVLDVVQARNVSTFEKVVDPVVGIGTALATAASFTVAAPVAAPLAIAGAAYLGGRAVVHQVNHLQHGGEWGEKESFINMAMIATTALPMGASGLRMAGMMRNLNLTKGQAFLAGMGAVRADGALTAAADAGKLSRLWHKLPYGPGQVSTYMRTAGGLNKAAYALDGSAMVIGAPLMYVSAEDLVLHYDQMSGLQIADAITGFTTGLAGTGMGAASFVSYAGANKTPAPSPTRVGDMSTSSPGRGDGEESTADTYAGRSGDGSIPIASADKQASPDQQAFPVKVVPAGTDDVGASGLLGIANGGQDWPAGGDPIVLPSGAVARSNDFPRAVWDPDTQTLSGMPERDTGEYIYTSAKDGKPSGIEGESPYLRGLNNEQLVELYNNEKAYIPFDEMLERYGANGPVLTERSIQDMLPDFRLGVSLKVVYYGGYIGLGSPTKSAYGFGLGTKSDYGAIAWAVADSVSQRSLTPLKDQVSISGAVSNRPQEGSNPNLREVGLSTHSHQLAFPIRASDLAKVASKALFTENSGFDVQLKNGREVGMTRDGSAAVVEVTYSPSLKGTEYTPAVGEHDFMGVPASEKDKFVRLEGELPYDRVMTELKVKPRVRALTNFSELYAGLPRVGMERRPESTIKDGPRPGDALIKQHFDQAQFALSKVELKTQLRVEDPAKVPDLLTAIEEGDLGTIRAMANDGIIDAEQALSLVGPPSESGFRLSAVPNKLPHNYIRTLTGDIVRVPNPKSMLKDVIFNTSAPDRMLAAGYYKLRNGISAKFRLDGNSPTPARYIPNGRKVHDNVYGDYDRPAIRTTVSFSTPPVPLLLWGVTMEVRGQYKSSPKTPARPIAQNEMTKVTFESRGGHIEELQAPVWLSEVVQTSSERSPMIIPKGGKDSLNNWLKGLADNARNDQKPIIDQFRSKFGKVLSDGKFLRTKQADDVLTFMSSQTGSKEEGVIFVRDGNGQGVVANRYGLPPASADKIYLLPDDGVAPQLGDPALTDKTHLFYRDPQTGEPTVVPWNNGELRDPASGDKPSPDRHA